MKNSLLSVSIDDGHPLDMKAAEILGRKNVKTTFYIPIKNSTGRPTLNRRQIKWLSQQPNFEIGGHTYNHINLTKVSLELAEKEIRTGKDALEDIIGKRITTFAFPWGKYTHNLVELVRNIGFLDCRSATTLNLHPLSKGSFLWYPNLHIYPHIGYRGLLNSIRRGDLYSFASRVERITTPYLDELTLFKKQNKPYHLWFHSWEIEELNMWSYIENL